MISEPPNWTPPARNRVEEPPLRATVSIVVTGGGAGLSVVHVAFFTAPDRKDAGNEGTIAWGFDSYFVGAGLDQRKGEGS